MGGKHGLITSRFFCGNQDKPSKSRGSFFICDSILIPVVRSKQKADFLNSNRTTLF